MLALAVACVVLAVRLAVPAKGSSLLGGMAAALEQAFWVAKAVWRGPRLGKRTAQVPSSGGPRKTLVLDLDETLVHVMVRKPWWLRWIGGVRCPEMMLVLGDRFARVHVAVRPHAEEFLAEAAQMYDLAVFTAAERSYAEPIIEMLDGGKRRLSERYYREACRQNVQADRVLMLKDLRVLGRSMDRVAIVDNCATGYALQRSNGIPISSWGGDPFDRDLLDLLPLLRRMHAAEDVRSVLQSEFM